MQQQTIEIPAAFYDALLKKLYSFNHYDFILDTAGMTILAAEEYRFRTNSDQMFMLALEKTNTVIRIHIVCGGGGEGLFSWTWGSENSCVSRIVDIIRSFCTEQNTVMKFIGSNT